MFSLSALAAIPTNVARDAMVVYEAPGGHVPPQGNIGRVNDGDLRTQLDITGWITLIWEDAQVFDFLLVEQNPGNVAGWYEIQIAAPGISYLDLDPANDLHWVTLGTFGAEDAFIPSGTSQVSNGLWMNHFSADLYDPTLGTVGVRFNLLNAGDTGNGGAARIREIWAFQGFNNVAPQATFSAPGWDGVVRLNDESFVRQCDIPTSRMFADGNKDNLDPENRINRFIYATFAEAVTLDGCGLIGGSGADVECMSAYDLAYFDSTLGEEGEWVTVLEVRNNTDKIVWSSFAQATSDQWRFHFVGADHDGYGRVSEIMLFAAIPEPATMTLLALGGLSLLRRRR